MARSAFASWIGSESSRDIMRKDKGLNGDLDRLPRAAERPELWTHLVAIAWQALWIGLIVTVSARLFRRGVLKLIQRAGVPVILDAGVGTASDAARAMEMGVDGILMNTAIAGAKSAPRMAVAMKQAVTAGRHAYLAGRIPMKLYATASSPLDGLIPSL